MENIFLKSTLVRRRSAAAVVAVLLAMQLGLLITSARGESQTVDEGAHLASGYSYWRTGDFRLNPEHPPLIKLIASVPLLLLPIHFPGDLTSWHDANEWEFAHQLIYHNTVGADTIIFWARFPMMLVGILFSFVVYRESKRLWGVAGGVLSLGMIVLDPNFLANERYVTTDIGMTLLFFLTIMTFGRYLQKPQRNAWLPVILLFSLAQLAKFSAVLLWPIMILLWVFRWWTAPDAERHHYRFGMFVRRFGLLLGASVIVSWALYGFSVTRPMEDPELAALYRTEATWRTATVDASHSLASYYQRLTDPRTLTGAFIKDFLTAVPVPAYTFIRGLLNVTFHNYWGHSSYLMGQYRVMGWWQYFPVVFAIKTPLPTLFLFFFSGMLLLASGKRTFSHTQYHGKTRRSLLSRIRSFLGGRRFWYVTLLIPPLYYFASSMTSHINLGIRHIFPVYPFLFVLAGSLAQPRWNTSNAYRYGVVALLVAWLAFSSFRIYPHYLSYFSDGIGGSKNGYRFVVDSNLDWGQELKHLGEYLKTNNIPFVYIAYFGQAPLEVYISDFRYLPSSDQPELIAQLDGYAAISMTALYADEKTYVWLRRYTPVARIGDAINVYDVRKNE